MRATSKLPESEFRQPWPNGFPRQNCFCLAVSRGPGKRETIRSNGTGFKPIISTCEKTPSAKYLNSDQRLAVGEPPSTSQVIGGESGYTCRGISNRHKHGLEFRLTHCKQRRKYFLIATDSRVPYSHCKPENARLVAASRKPQVLRPELQRAAATRGKTQIFERAVASSSARSSTESRRTIFNSIMTRLLGE